jgi:hypothetical protein
MTIEEHDNQKEQTKKDLEACYARTLLGDDDGKRVLRDILVKGGYGRSVFRRLPGQRYDAMEAALNEGARMMALEIEIALQRAAPQQWAAFVISHMKL